VLACLRSAQFLYRNARGGVVVELRRHHDIDARYDNKEFVVTKRLIAMPVLMTKSFGTYREASKYWDEEVSKLKDEGLEQQDVRIIGFREEG
jgi:hypothetical protein